MEIVSAIVNIGRNFVDPIKEHCGYLFQYKSNIKNLEDQNGDLHAKINEVQSKIDADRNNGLVSSPMVLRWVEKAHNIHEEARNILKEARNILKEARNILDEDARNILDEDAEANRNGLGGWCPRYSLSMKAKKKTLDIEALLNDRHLSEAPSFRPLLGIGSSSTQRIMDLESRTEMGRKVLEALRADKVYMIAICGMGGIGKTTMAKEVAKRAKDEDIFDEVAMAVVSQNQDLRNIQVHIAEMLCLKLDEENPLSRAARLNDRLSMPSKSVLVILDDVWDALDLEAVGIPYGVEHNRCKILLTSQSEETCTQMQTQKIFPIEVLSEKEAWILFREMAGNCIDTPEIHPIAKEVAKECGGLPVAIVTVGRALENKCEFDWSDALQLLRNAIPKKILGLDPKAYSGIEFSYNYLKNDEAKSCFLLCCLFPEDYDIPIEDLVRYGMGQRLFAGIDTVAQARNRVHTIVKHLKRSFLLLDSRGQEQFVKMHDVVRVVAISIAKNQGFLVQCNEKVEEWPKKDSCECSTKISIVSKQLKRHPDGLECPKLELLRLESKIKKFYVYLLPPPPPPPLPLPPNLFKGMKGLKVLTLFGMSFPSLPQSINVLQNLRTLQFVNCYITNVSAIGELRKLEILSFLKSKIKKLPGEMRNLSHLKLLELTLCIDDLEKIPPNLLSSLSHLEEFYMLGLDEEEEEVDEEEEEEIKGANARLKKGANARLTELMSLPLEVLKIQIPNIKVLPKDLPFKNAMIKFHIDASVAGAFNEVYEIDADDYLFENSLKLARCDGSDIVESQPLLQLLKKCKILKLKLIKDIKNIAYELDNEGFRYLKVLQVWRSQDVEYVMDATPDQNPRAAFPALESLELHHLYNLKEICHSPFPERSFSGVHSQLACFRKLRSILLHSCKCLKNVFSLSIARGLDQLQKLDIWFCGDMEECFHMEGEDEKALIDIIMFPQLTSIELASLPRLIGFCTGVGPIELVQPSLNREVGRIGIDEVTNLEKHKMTDIKQHTGPFPESTPIISHKLFSSYTILWAPNLENLELKEADSLEVVFDLEGLKANNDHQGIAVLAQLKTLEVNNLSELRYVWKNVPLGIQGFQKLTSIEVSCCHCLRYLFPTSIAKLLVELQSIEIEECDAIENIVQRDGEEEATDIILFPRVSSLKLRELPNMMSFRIKTYFEWSSIKEIYLEDCFKLKPIGSEIQSPRKSKEISRELDSRPNEQELGCLGFLLRCRECLGLMAVSDQGTTNKSQRSYSVKEEGMPKDPKVNDSDNPSEIWSFFPSHIIECLKNLQSIVLGHFHLEVIFQLDELNVEETHMAPVLDQLRNLNLNNLQKLVHIWKKGPERIWGFGNMRYLEVKECNSLTYLFSPSIAKLLVRLTSIRVVNCERIEEILARAGEEKEEKEVLFHEVNRIHLEDLPNLKRFCNEANALEWPLLEYIGVIRCPALSTFIPSNLIMPKLERVYGGGRYHWEGDLNATIEHIFKGKEKQANHETEQEEQIETIEKDM